MTQTLKELYMADITKVLDKKSILIGGVDIIDQRLNYVTLKDDIIYGMH